MHNYKEAINDLLQDWDDFHSLIPTYRKYVEKIKKLKKEYRSCKDLKVDKISESFLRDEFPRNNFLNLSTLDEAIDYLNNCTPSQLETLSKVILYEKEGVFYTRMRKWIRSAQARIKTAGRPTSYHYNSTLEQERKETMKRIVASI